MEKLWEDEVAKAIALIRAAGRGDLLAEEPAGGSGVSRRGRPGRRSASAGVAAAVAACKTQGGGKKVTGSKGEKKGALGNKGKAPLKKKARGEEGELARGGMSPRAATKEDGDESGGEEKEDGELVSSEEEELQEDKESEEEEICLSDDDEAGGPGHPESGGQGQGPRKTALEIQTGWQDRERSASSSGAKGNAVHFSPVIAITSTEPDGSGAGRKRDLASKSIGRGSGGQDDVSRQVPRLGSGSGHRQRQPQKSTGERCMDAAEVWQEVWDKKGKEWDEKFETQWKAHEREVGILQEKRKAFSKLMCAALGDAKKVLTDTISEIGEATAKEKRREKGKGILEVSDEDEEVPDLYELLKKKEKRRKRKEKKADKEKERGVIEIEDEGDTDKDEKKRKKEKMPFMGMSQPLGEHLSRRMIKKIQAGKYVEIFKLLHREVQAKEGSKEEERELAKRPQVPETLENWVSAFSIYAAVYLEKCPEEGPAIMKYMDIVRNAQVNFGGSAWLRYDDEFRTRKAVRPGLRWDCLDQDMWLTIMTPTRPLAHAHTASGHSMPFAPFRGLPAQGGYGGRGNRIWSGGRGASSYSGPCWNFNRGSCTRHPCWFEHKCKQCGGNHSVLQCYGAARGTGGATRRGGRSFGGKGGYSN